MLIHTIQPKQKMKSSNTKKLTENSSSWYGRLPCCDETPISRPLDSIAFAGISPAQIQDNIIKHTAERGETNCDSCTYHLEEDEEVSLISADPYPQPFHESSSPAAPDLI